MKTILVLAMHGLTPSNFPPSEKAEYFRLRNQRGGAGEKNLDSTAQQRLLELEEKIRNWPRTASNDPYYQASIDLAAALKQETGFDTLIGFNEFCAPTIEAALEQAAKQRPEQVIVMTPMMTRGSGHSDVEIPEVIRRVQIRFPAVPIHYAWPFDDKVIAKFLSDQIQPLVKPVPQSPHRARFQ